MDYERDDSSLGDESGLFARPIVVGYVFGPKKMSTMGVVMAEASRTKLVASTHNNLDVPRSRIFDEDDEQNNEAEEDAQMDEDDLEGQTTVADQIIGLSNENSSSPPTTAVLRQNTSTSRRHSITPTGSTAKQILFYGDPKHATLPSIVRHLQSSDVSDCGESMGTCTASTSGSQWTATTTMQISSTSSRSAAPVSVAFVPLDPETPFEDQHGGKMDIILHKLTEDILCVSKLNHLNPSVFEMDEATLPSSLTDAEAAAARRVRRLYRFQLDNPACCVVDNPLLVKTLMSRADIAQTLERCLVGVTSESGIPVTAPRFSVVEASTLKSSNPGQIVSEMFSTANLAFPIIAKPLTAAGTKASHRMSVLLSPSGVSRLTESCLCQEYRNHNAALYKVYVLGGHISVHKRRSLPNLPHDQDGRLAESKCNFVEFDSQRPYPRLEEFGFANDTSKGAKECSHCETQPSSGRRWVTKEEVTPIVGALKRAFGLEIFGFDILISSDRQEMLVVDVNYFPSYKEVPNFPALLASYLTDRAVQSRQNSLNTHTHHHRVR